MTKEIPLVAETIVGELISEIIKINDDLIAGFYLTGSISLNDFHPNKSDIDFLILSDKRLTDELRLQLEHVHKRIDRQFKKIKLNGCYITPDALNVNHSQTTKVFYYHEGKLKASAFEMAPVTLYELKTTAITIQGTAARQLPVIVEISDVNKFLFENINSYWKNWIAQHSSLTRRQLLLVLFPRLSEWVILGVARQWYTLKTGKITSKTGAGYYCLQHLPDKYHNIIQKSIQIRIDKNNHILNVKPSYFIQTSVKRARETIACSNYILSLFNKEYRENKI